MPFTCKLNRHLPDSPCCISVAKSQGAHLPPTLAYRQSSYIKYEIVHILHSPFISAGLNAINFTKLPETRMAESTAPWWRKVQGTESTFTRTRAAHGLRRSPLPEYRRVLGWRDGDFHASRRHVHERMQVLRCEERQSKGRGG